MSPTHTFYIKAERDAEAKVWFVADSDVPGLAAEARNVEELVELLHRLVPECLEANGVFDDDWPQKVPFSVMLDHFESERHAG